MLKLPEPLPYDYVDELINQKFLFRTEVSYYLGARMNIFRAWPRGEDGGLGQRGNTNNPLISWKYDHYGSDKDDEIVWNGMGGHKWTSEEFTEKELDLFVKGMDIGSILARREINDAEVSEDSECVQAGPEGQDADGPVEYTGVGVPSRQPVAVH